MYEEATMDARADHAEKRPMNPVQYAGSVPGPKASEVRFLEEALDRNAAVLELLETSLYPVLNPSYGPGENAYDTPVVSRLAELRMRLESQTETLKRIIDRIEV